MDQAISSDNAESPSESVSTDFLEGFISEPEYARQRRVTPRTCQRDRQLRKAPPYIKFGRQVFYRIEAVRDWLINNERIADQPPDAPRSRSLRNQYLTPRGKRPRPQPDQVGETRQPGG
ncbi:MAG: hypothetical protein WA214_04045 [Pseudolabrys sp.]